MNTLGVRRQPPYLAFGFATMLIAWIQLARNGKLSKGEKAGAAVASTIVLLALALLGEASPDIATGFAALLFVAVLLGGTDAVGYLFQTLPHNLISGTTKAATQ